jgi:hypothetical protein
VQVFSKQKKCHGCASAHLLAVVGKVKSWHQTLQHLYAHSATTAAAAAAVAAILLC